MLRRRVTNFTLSTKIKILIKLFIEKVEIFHNCLKLSFFLPEIKTPFYWFVSDPVSDAFSDPDSNPDPKCLFRIRIWPKVYDPYGSGSGSGSATLLFVPLIKQLFCSGSSAGAEHRCKKTKLDSSISSLLLVPHLSSSFENLTEDEKERSSESSVQVSQAFTTYDSHSP